MSDTFLADLPPCKTVTIVCLAVLMAGQILLVRKRGLNQLILPGGKPEPGETDEQALRREALEELGCEISKLEFVGIFVDQAAGAADTLVEVRLFEGSLTGDPAPASEIEDLVWIDVAGPWPVPLAPSLENKILGHFEMR